MLLRKTSQEEINSVMKLIEEGRKYFKANDIPQWQNGKPNLETIQSDIDKGCSYVLVDGDEIVGTCALFFENDNTYDVIDKGRWMNDNNYAVIHRVCIKCSYKGHGLGSEILRTCEELSLKQGIDNIRIDTHQLNLSMQRLLSKNNYTYCGIIYLEDGAERFAFQKVLK